MATTRHDHINAPAGSSRFARLRRRFHRSEDGTAAIEFAILALPFFMLVFATIEVFVAFAGEQLLGSAVDTMGRKIRTGQITFTDPSKSSYMTAEEFRAAFCEEISLMMKCSPDGEGRPVLYLDVQNYMSFANMPKKVPRQGGAPYGDLDTSSFDYDPGGPGTINMVRAYYRWSVTTDVIRPYITNVRATADGVPEYYLMVATAAFRNESYP